MDKKVFKDEVDVLKYQRDKLNSIDKGYSDLNNDIDEFEKRLQEFVKKQNISIPDNFDSNTESKQEKSQCKASDFKVEENNQARDFNTLLNKAHEEGYLNVNLYDVATKEEINEANMLLKNQYKEYTDKYKLDKYDYAISGIIGSIAALMDFFLVTKVNGKIVTPGRLKSGAENFWNSILSEEKIKELEKKYKVTYDISMNTSKISQDVLGLCPTYHRFQSLGHDPIIGFVFGIADLMKGQLTAIDGNGRLIIQAVQGAKTMPFIESIITVFGHFLSDVGTKSDTGKILSVPAPFTPLLQLIKVGSIEYNGKTLTVGDLAKKMYYDGYNFNHFIGMSIPVLLIEILTRLAFVIKEIFFSKGEISLKKNPKLTVMLCIANGILFAENVGKLAITNNPFAINYVSWIATAKYGFKTLKWVAYDKELGKMDYAQQYIDDYWRYLEWSANELDKEVPIYYVK